ncbi:MAG: hypothetical protein CME15_08035 [Gemmatimonadetes bacterium]|nr:hypothetical protein [Gemmatimonadota bacterium]
MIDGGPVIDFHGHVGRWDTVGMVDDPATMLRAMDRVGIDRSCVFDIFHPDGTRGNDRTAAFVALNPERFVGFAYVSPLMADRVVPELERAVDDLGFRAVKLYPPYTPYPLNDPIWDPVYEFANDRGLAVLSHTDTSEQSQPGLLAQAAHRFPKARFVAGHSGNIEPARGQAIAAAQRCPNFYLETCSTYRSPGVIEELVREAGADRVLFGSDTPLMDPRAQIGKIITADLTDEEKRMVLGGNAIRLLGL